MSHVPFLRLQDAVARPPFPAIIAVLMLFGLIKIGSWFAHARRQTPEPLDVASSFVVVVGTLACITHALALAQIAHIPLLRGVGISLGAVGVFSIVNNARSNCMKCQALVKLASTVSFGKLAVWVLGLTLLGLGAAALGPATDADSLAYHLGVPLDWLRHHGALAQPNWAMARLVGIGESLNMLGLATGTDCFGATLQFAGIFVAATALDAMAREPRDRVLGWLLAIRSTSTGSTKGKPTY